jgi:hypothetical protein
MKLFHNYNSAIRFGAKILPSEILGGYGIGIGNVYIVYNAADTDVTTDLIRNYGGVKYADGSTMLYAATSTTANVAIQAALDACVANRNDYVVVMPSGTNYGLAAPLTMSKKGVHLVCPAGVSGNGSAIGNTARIKQLAAYTGIIVSAQAVEIAGFYLKNYTGKSMITLAGSTYAGGSAGSASSPNIHHNSFMMVWSGTPDPIIMPYSGTDDGGSWGVIENNWFISETGTGITSPIAAISINAQATGCRVRNNEVTIGDANVATVGISNHAVKGRTDFNLFSESGGSGVTSGGTITNSISIAVTGAATGNRCSVAAGGFATGGTAAHSFTDNTDGATGSGNGQASNLEA